MSLASLTALGFSASGAFQSYYKHLTTLGFGTSVAVTPQASLTTIGFSTGSDFQPGYKHLATLGFDAGEL